MFIALARWVMTGSWQGPLLAAFCFMSSWTSWLSLAILGLVGLRKGAYSAGFVAVCMLSTQLMPVAFFNLVDVVAVVVVSVAVIVLRSTVRLDWALLVATATAFACLSVVQFLSPGVLEQLIGYYQLTYEMIEDQLPESIHQAWQQQELPAIVMQSVSVAVAFKSFIALFIARWWQSKLYNPGGFQQEFLQLKLVPSAVWILSLAYVAIVLMWEEGMPLAELLRVPLFVAGLALAAWWFAEKQVASISRLVFFCTLPLTYPLVVLLGICDSFWNLRKRLMAG